jgi:hypothetical protein
MERSAVVVYVKNEEHLMAEWISHYVALGFRRVYVYLNECNDDTTVLVRRAALHRPNIIQAIDWPDEIAALHHDRQRTAYNDALSIACEEGYDWLLAVDADEFLVSTTGELIGDLTGRCAEQAAIGLYWAFYGSNGHVTQPRGLVTENFVMRGPEHFGPSRLIKSMVRVPLTMGCHNAHTFSLNFPYSNCRNEPISWSSVFGQMDQPPVFSPWRLNHYFVQSRQQWAKKLTRSLASNGFSPRRDDDFATYDQNEIFDPTAILYGDRIRGAAEQLGVALSQGSPFLTESLTHEWNS